MLYVKIGGFITMFDEAGFKQMIKPVITQAMLDYESKRAGAKKCLKTKGK